MYLFVRVIDLAPFYDFPIRFLELSRSCVVFVCFSLYYTLYLDRDMKIDIATVVLTSDMLAFTQCNLSRPLLPGEDISILVNDRPIRTTQGSSNVQYLGDISSLYPRIQRNGYHRCEVRGLHNQQIWSIELYYEQPSEYEEYTEHLKFGVMDVFQKYFWYMPIRSNATFNNISGICQ